MKFFDYLIQLFSLFYLTHLILLDYRLSDILF